MTKSNQNHLDWSDEKKGRKVKKHHSEEACKCFAPFLKLHWHDCPAVNNKPCPIHGIHFDCNAKDQKEESEQSVTISFYPSSRTERLFQPVKSLLAQCKPDTKINLQYFSPRDFPNKGSIKHKLIQTSSEDMKMALNNNVFVEKSKSFTTDKTNKMKKLKQCFHSPCNSIAKKSRSQVSFREKVNEIFCDETHHRNAFLNMNLEEPRDDVKYDPSFEWSFPSKMAFENLEKLSDERKDSDFITFTQHAKNNVINHKIFEIKHKKGLNDISKVKIGKQPTQFVYTSFASGRTGKEPTGSYNKKNKIVSEKKPSEESKKTKKKHETSSASGNSQSSSSGSVYVTPFFLMPTGVEDSDSDRPKASKMSESVLVEGEAPEKQWEFEKETQTPSQWNIQKEPKSKSISLQTKPSVEEKHSQCTREIFLHDYEPSMEPLDKKFEEGKIKALGEDFSDDSCWRRKCEEALRGKKESSKYTRTIEVQTSNNYRYKEVIVSTRCDRSIRDKTSQTETFISETRHREFESKTNKTQTTRETHYSKEIQTSFFDNAIGSDGSKSSDFDYSDATKSSEEPEQVGKNVKPWWRKSLSDSELFGKKKCVCLKLDSQIPVSQNCCCKCSNLSPHASIRDYCLPTTFTKIFETTQASESTNPSDNIAPEVQKAVEHVSKAEQTSLIEEDYADLSELKKIIQEFFEKRDINTGKKLDGETPTVNQGKIDSSTMTEDIVFKPSQDLKNAVDVETQTTVHVLMDVAMDENHTKLRGQRVKFRQSILLDDENQIKTFFICALCGREINKFSVNASTNTENLSSRPKMKEKTTVVDTEINEVITVKTIKKSQNGQSSTGGSKPSGKQITYSPTENATTLKAEKDSPRGTNFQRSCIPILITAPGSAHLRYDETITMTENPKEYIESPNQNSTNRQIQSKPQNSRSSASPQTSTQCFCNETPGPSESGISETLAPASTKASKAKGSKTRRLTGLYPSVPKVEHPGVQNSQQWRNNEKGGQRKTDGYFYPVIINSFWPREFMRTWESMEKYNNRPNISSNQKRSYEKDEEPTDTPAEKKIKPFFEDPSKKFFVFGRSSYTDLFRKEKCKTSLGKYTGFIWDPSPSDPQIPSHNSISNQSKTTKSEEFLKNSHQQVTQVQVEKFNSDVQSEIFTVKSCHLKPITFKNDEQSFNRLFECSFCNSFTFLKTDQKDVAWLKTNTYQPRALESNLNESVSQELTHDGPFRREKEFLRECSHFSDDNENLESLENTISEEEITEAFEETYPEPNSQGPKLESHSQIVNAFDNSFNYDMATTSKSLNTFWFGRNTKTMFLKNHPNKSNLTLKNWEK